MLEAARRLILKFGFRIHRTTKKEDLDRLANFLSPTDCIDMIRVGSANDGGYILPKGAVEKAKFLFCAGVADDCNFELEFSRTGVSKTVLLADGSIERPPLTDKNFQFMDKYIGPESGGEWIAFDKWVETGSSSDGLKILSMDIEGGEWSLFSDCFISTWEKFEVIVIELHSMHLALDPIFFEARIVPMMKVLNGFKTVHVHANNSGWIEKSRGFSFPSLLEVTLVKRDWAGLREDKRMIPSHLDAPNLPFRKDLNFIGFKKRKRVRS